MHFNILVFLRQKSFVMFATKLGLSHFKLFTTDRKNPKRFVTQNISTSSSSSQQQIRTKVDGGANRVIVYNFTKLEAKMFPCVAHNTWLLPTRVW